MTALSSILFATSSMGAIAAVPSSPLLKDGSTDRFLSNVPPAPAHQSGSGLLITQANTRPRIAVLDFDYTPTIGSYLSAFPGFAEGVSVVLVDRLVNGGNYSVIERSQIEAVLQEQNLGQSGRVDASTAAQIGRILGVDAVIIGSITKFNYDVSDRGINVFGVGTRREIIEAEVQLNVRMVNTSTAEIMRTAEGVGTAEDTASSVRVTGVFGQDSDPENVQQVLSQATDLAIAEVVDSLNGAAADMADLPPTLPTETAVIADVSGSTLIVNRGTANGYRSGMCLSVERLVREVLDPETQEVIHQVTETAGQIQLTDVSDRSSVGQIIAGSSSALAVGDVAKPVDCPN
ncbi:MAG: CsgG/HfaB family protein [Elainellaceae cyanobacterium]